jgi:tubulysin polyketide synthase-like protein
MNAPTLLATLAARGLTVTVDGSALRVSPRDGLTDELRQSIREHRSELLPLLPSYRWRITGSKCGVFEACFLPEATRAEVSALFPGATVAPLADNIAPIGD